MSWITNDMNISSFKQSRYVTWFLLLCGFFLILWWFFHGNRPMPALRPSVLVAQVQKKDIPVYIPALGNVVPTYTVTVKTQINGLLMKVLYHEGQFVKKGDALVEIDDRLLKAQLEQYEGQLGRDQALLDNALIDLKRYQTLWKQNAISEQTLATQVALVKQHQGSVTTDKGLIESTKVNLMYCHITSPIDGRVGLRLVDPGNFVQVSDTTGIAVITTLDPMTVIFPIPEDNIPDVLPSLYAHKKIVVEAYDRQNNSRLATGQLITMDNQVDPTTGTVKLRATFSNNDHRLFSNQFVNINVLARTLPNAVVIPTAAVQHSGDGDFVYVLQADFHVLVQPITTGVTYGDDTVVVKGVTPGQNVVTQGVDKLTPGMIVNVV